MLFALISFALGICSMIYAVTQGNNTEKLGGLIIGLMVASSYLRDIFYEPRFMGFDTIGFAIDLIGFSAFFAVALFALRVWPIWASAFQLISVCAHVVQELQIPIDPMAYALMRYSPTTLASFSLLLGAALSAKKGAEKIGSKECWRDWSALSNQMKQTR